MYNDLFTITLKFWNIKELFIRNNINIGSAQSIIQFSIYISGTVIEVYLSLGNNLNTNVINYLLMSSDIKPDQTECKECGKSFDTTEGLEQHYELEHKWKNKKI